MSELRELLKKEERDLYAVAEDLLASDDEPHAGAVFMACGELRRILALLDSGERPEPVAWGLFEGGDLRDVAETKKAAQQVAADIAEHYEVEVSVTPLYASPVGRAPESKQSLPYPEDQGRTHFEGCWAHPRHHNCAVVEIERLRAPTESRAGEER